MHEEWRPIAGFPDYEVSSWGRVRRITDGYGANGNLLYPAGRFLKPQPNQRGYLLVHLYAHGKKQTISVAKLVCTAFHGDRPTPRHQIAHWNGVRSDNCAANLRWATIPENMFDKKRHGTAMHMRGQRHPKVKLTAEQVIVIKRRLALGDLASKIALEFNVTSGAIGGIKSGKNWGWVNPQQSTSPPSTDRP